MMGWSPDGKRLLFGSDRTGSVGLWSQPLADGKPHGTPELVKAEIGLVEPMGMTRAGSLYYGTTTGRARSSIHVASFDFITGKISSSRDVSQNYLESNANQSWSPDGKYLAYVSTRGPDSALNKVIVIRSTETGQVVGEPQPKAEVALGGWAPDGRSLVGIGQVQGRRGVLRIDVQTGAVALLFEHSMDEPPKWSPDGKSIYFRRTLSNGKEFAFIQRDLASGVEKEVIRRPFLGRPNLSPDGRYIATPSVDIASNSRVHLLIPTDGRDPLEVMRVAPEVEPADLKNYDKGLIVVGAHGCRTAARSLLKNSVPATKKATNYGRFQLTGALPARWILRWKTRSGT